MACTVKRIVGWNQVLNTARTTVGKDDLDKEPSDKFKRQILISEHSPIRNLTFEAVWDSLPYWVVNHLARHHVGFHSGEDDTVFVETQRSDRTGIDREKLPQDAPVTFRTIINAHSIINVSRVRLCKLSAIGTVKAWRDFIDELAKIEPILAALCVPNCLYRSFCPESNNSCLFVNSTKYQEDLEKYRNLNIL